jgi:molybdopterin-binding protein
MSYGWTSVLDRTMITGIMSDISGYPGRLRLGQAAEILGVSPDTVRRWTVSGRLPARRTPGGQRTVARDDVARLAAERRRSGRERPIVAMSARNRFPGVVVAVRRDEAAAAVEVIAGPHRLVSLITRESADELDLAPGKRVVCVVKATDVMIDVSS